MKGVSDYKMEISLTKQTYDGEVLKSDIPVLVDFWAPWCGPCQMLGPIISEVAEEYEGRIKVGKVNVDEEGELAAANAIVSIPTVMLFNNGKLEGKLVGARSFDDYADIIDKIL